MYSQRQWWTAIPVFSALALMAYGATIKFDQSQTGDYNLQIHLKNIELYALFDDSSSSDDDYSDLPDYTDSTDSSSKPPSDVSSTGTTIAPLKPSTSATLYGSTASEATVAGGSTEAPTPFDPYSTANNEKIVQMVEALIASNGNTSDLPAEPPVVTQSPLQSQPQSPQPSLPPTVAALSAASSAASATGSTSNRKCGLGYFRDPMGRCRRIRKPHLPFLQMVHTPGVIKSFQPQQRTVDDVGPSKEEKTIQ